MIEKRDEQHEEHHDDGLVEVAAGAFVKHVTEGDFDAAAQAVSIAIGVARLIESEDPVARSRW